MTFWEWVFHLFIKIYIIYLFFYLWHYPIQPIEPLIKSFSDSLFDSIFKTVLECLDSVLCGVCLVPLLWWMFSNKLVMTWLIFTSVKSSKLFIRNNYLRIQIYLFLYFFLCLWIDWFFNCFHIIMLIVYLKNCLFLKPVSWNSIQVSKSWNAGTSVISLLYNNKLNWLYPRQYLVKLIYIICS